MDISWFGLVNGQTLSCDVNAGAVSECFTYLVSGDLVYITRSEEEISSIAYTIITDMSSFTAAKITSSICVELVLQFRSL